MEYSRATRVFVIATQPRHTPQYKVDIIFERQCTRNYFLPDMFQSNFCLVMTISLDFLDNYGI
jgi:hypothetical protein